MKAMKKTLIYIIIAVIAVLAAVAAVWMQPETGNISGEKLFPDLGEVETLNKVERIQVSREDKVRFTAFRGEDGLWRLQQRGDYLVDPRTVNKVLTSASEATKLERKTDNPAYYARLGVNDKGENAARLLTLFSVNKEWRVLIGSPALGNKSGQYVRLSNEKESWLIDRTLYVPSNAVDWLNRRIVHVEPNNVRRVTLKNPRFENAVVLVRSAKGKDINYETATETESDEEDTSMGLEFSARQVLAVADYLNFLEVLDRVEILKSLKDNKPISATYETFDGLMLTLNAYETAGQDHYMTLDVAQSSSPTEKVVKEIEEL